MDPRTFAERKRDTLVRLASDVDCWVATASADGGPYMMPLSFLWDGSGLLMSTTASNPTAVNLRASGTVRLGLGLTRDVVLIEGTVSVPSSISDSLGDEFAVKTGFDPRKLKTKYDYFLVAPQRIQAWREVNELAARDIMRDGQWLG